MSFKSTKFTTYNSFFNDDTNNHSMFTNPRTDKMNAKDTAFLLIQIYLA